MDVQDLSFRPPVVWMSRVSPFPQPEERTCMQCVSLSTTSSMDVQGVSLSTASRMDMQGVPPFTTNSLNMQGVYQSFACGGSVLVV
jgi:hypothetical protein